MPEQRRRFSPQFKAEAVQLVIETGKPIAEVARDLGIHAITVPRPTAFVARVTDENDAPLAGATVQSDEYTADVAGNARLWPGRPDLHAAGLGLIRAIHTAHYERGRRGHGLRPPGPDPQDHGDLRPQRADAGAARGQRGDASERPHRRAPKLSGASLSGQSYGRLSWHSGRRTHGRG